MQPISGPQVLDSTAIADAAGLREAGYWLHLVRAIEAAGRRLYLQGRLPGSFYDGYGQEATAVGAGLALAPRDIACPVIRDLAVHLIRGITPAEVLRHYLGQGRRADGRPRRQRPHRLVRARHDPDDQPPARDAAGVHGCRALAHAPR